MNAPRLLALSIASLLFGPLPLFGVTDTWDGGGGNDDFSTDANWADDTAPVSSPTNTDLVFGSGSLHPHVDSPFNAHSIEFTAIPGTLGFILDGLTLSVGSGGIVNNDPKTSQFENVVSFSGVASSTINANNGGLIFDNTVVLPTSTLTVTGFGDTSFKNFTGTSALNKSGAGTMTWTPNATANFAVTVAAGTLAMGADGLGDVFGSNATIAINGTSTFNINESLILDGALLTRTSGANMNLAAGKTLTVQNGGDVTLSGAFTNTTASSIIVTGTGSTFSSSNSSLEFGGGSSLSVQAGGTVASNAVNIGTSGDGTAAVTGSGSTLDTFSLNVGLAGYSGTLIFSSGSRGSFTEINIDSFAVAGTSGQMTVQSGAVVTGTDLLLANSAVANNGAITITGAGSALTLTGSGTTTIGAASASSGTLTVENGGTFTTGTGLTMVNATGSIHVNAGGTMIVRGNMTVQSSLDIAGTVSLDATAPAPAEETDDLALADLRPNDFSFEEGANGFSMAEGAAVPEPSVALLALLGGAFAGMRRNRSA